MIDRKYRGEDLIGKKCRPVRSIRNGGGDGITTDTVCTIKDVVRGHGFTIQTDKCPHCGQFAYIARVNRNDLKLIEGAENEDRAMVLLEACLALLDKQKESRYVLNLSEQTVVYDGTDCDGYCLSDDIRDYLMEKGVLSSDEY